MPDGLISRDTEALQVDDLVNLEELASALKRSVPTVRKLIRENADFPVVERGDKGSPWRFCLGDVLTWWKAREDAEAEQAGDRANLLAGLVEPEAPGIARITPSQRKALAEAVRIEMRNAEEAGLLIPAARVQSVLTELVRELSGMLDQLPVTLQRQAGLSPDQAKMVKTVADAARATFVRDLRTRLLDRQASPLPEGGRLVA